MSAISLVAGGRRWRRGRGTVTRMSEVLFTVKRNSGESSTSCRGETRPARSRRERDVPLWNTASRNSCGRSDDEGFFSRWKETFPRCGGVRRGSRQDPFPRWNKAGAWHGRRWTRPMFATLHFHETSRTGTSEKKKPSPKRTAGLPGKTCRATSSRQRSGNSEVVPPTLRTGRDVEDGCLKDLHVKTAPDMWRCPRRFRFPTKDHAYSARFFSFLTEEGAWLRHNVPVGRPTLTGGLPHQHG